MLTQNEQDMLHWLVRHKDSGSMLLHITREKDVHVLVEKRLVILHSIQHDIPYTLYMLKATYIVTDLGLVMNRLHDE
jgi:hypothetical protein